MKKARIIVATAAILLGVVLFLLVWETIVSCFFGQPNIIKQINSPNDKYTAYIYERDGGATSGISYHLSILKAGKPINTISGNVFVSEYKFDFEWVSDDKLVVLNNGLATKQKTKIYGIDISYEK